MESAAGTGATNEFESKSKLLYEILDSEKFKNDKLRNLKIRIKNLAKKLGHYQSIGLHEKTSMVAFLNIFLAQPEPELLIIAGSNSNLYSILINFKNDNQDQIALAEELKFDVELILERIKQLTHKSPRSAPISSSDEESDHNTSASSSYESTNLENTMQSRRKNSLTTVTKDKLLILNPVGLALLDQIKEEIITVEQADDKEVSAEVRSVLPESDNLMLSTATTIDPQDKKVVDTNSTDQTMDSIIDPVTHDITHNNGSVEVDGSDSDNSEENTDKVMPIPQVKENGRENIQSDCHTSLSENSENRSDTNSNLDELDNICTSDSVSSKASHSVDSVCEEEDTDKVNHEETASESSITENDHHPNVINLDNEQTKKGNLKSAILRNKSVAKHFKNLTDAEKQLILEMHYQKEDRYGIDLSAGFAKEINTAIQQATTISKLLAKCDEAQIYLRDEVKQDAQLKQTIGEIEKHTKQLIKNSDVKANKDEALVEGHASIKNIMQATAGINSQKQEKIRLAAQKYLIFHEAKQKLTDPMYYLNPAERIKNFKNTLLSDANKQVLNKQRDPAIIRVMHTIGYLLGCAISFTVGFWTYLATTHTPLPTSRTESARIADACERAISKIKP